MAMHIPIYIYLYHYSPACFSWCSGCNYVQPQSHIITHQNGYDGDQGGSQKCSIATLQTKVFLVLVLFFKTRWYRDKNLFRKHVNHFTWLFLNNITTIQYKEYHKLNLLCIRESLNSCSVSSQRSHCKGNDDCPSTVQTGCTVITVCLNGSIHLLTSASRTACIASVTYNEMISKNMSNC